MYLLLSRYGHAMPVLYRLFKSGKDIKAFIRNVHCRRKLKGIISKVNSMKEGMDFKPELTIFDDVGTGNLADKMRSDDKNVFGGSILCDKLYFDPEFCEGKMKQLGFSYKELQGETSKLVLGIRFKLGEYVDSTCLVSTEAYYPMEFGDRLEGMCVLGWRNRNKLYEDEIKKLFPYVKKHKYNGILYLHFLTNSQGELSYLDISPFLDRNYFTCHATIYDNIFDLTEKASDNYACTLRVTIPPYPFSSEKYGEYVYMDAKGQKVGNLKGNFYPDDLMFEKDWVTSGNDGIIGDIYVSSTNLVEIIKNLTEQFYSIELDSKVARVDFADFIASKARFFALEGAPVARRTQTDYRVMYFNAVRKGTSEVIKVTRIIESEGLKLSEIIGV